MLQEKLLVDTTLKNMFRLDSTANTYRSAGVSEVYPKLPHGSNDCHQTLNGVAVDHGLVLELDHAQEGLVALKLQAGHGVGAGGG